MYWRITLILVIAFFMPYLARIPGMFIHGSEWMWSYIPSPEGFLFLSAFNLIALIPLAVLGFISANRGMNVAFIVTTIVYCVATFFFHSSYDLASDAQAAIGLVVFPFIIAGITLLTALISFFAERALK